MFKFPWFKKNGSIRITSIQRLNIKDGDLIVFTIPNSLSESAYKRLSAEIEKIFKEKGATGIILENGLKIQTITNKINKSPIK